MILNLIHTNKVIEMSDCVFEFFNEYLKIKYQDEISIEIL